MIWDAWDSWEARVRALSRVVCYVAAMHDDQPGTGEFGRILAVIQKRTGLSHQDIADVTGVNRSQVWRWVNSGSAPGYEPIRRLVAYLLAERPEVTEAAGQLLPAAGYETPPGDSFSYARLNTDVARHLAAVKAAIADAVMKNSGKPLTGTLVFPRDPKSAETWDALAQIGWPLETTAAALAVIWDARQKAASPDRSAAGLTLVQPQSATAGRGA